MGDSVGMLLRLKSAAKPILIPYLDNNNIGRSWRSIITILESILNSQIATPFIIPTSFNLNVLSVVRWQVGISDSEINSLQGTGAKYMETGSFFRADTGARSLRQQPILSFPILGKLETIGWAGWPMALVSGWPVQAPHPWPCPPPPPVRTVCEAWVCKFSLSHSAAPCVSGVVCWTGVCSAGTRHGSVRQWLTVRDWGQHSPGSTDSQSALANSPLGWGRVASVRCVSLVWDQSATRLRTVKLCQGSCHNNICTTLTIAAPGAG